MKQMAELHYVGYDCYNTQWKLDTRMIEDYEILFVTSGSGYLCIQGEKIPFAERDVLVIPPGRLHSLSSDRLPLSFCCVHFDLYCREDQRTMAVSAHCKKQEDSYIQGFLFHHERNLEKISFQKCSLELPLQILPEKHSLLEWRIKQFCEMIRQGKREEQNKWEILLAEILKELTVTPKDLHADDRAVAIMEYVAENYQRNITLEELSQKFYLTPAYISQLFKKSTHLTLTEYIRRYRISVAKGLLRYTNITLEEIADQTGFYDASHFCRKFLESEGISPARYRNKNCL